MSFTGRLFNWLDGKNDSLPGFFVVWHIAEILIGIYLLTEIDGVREYVSGSGYYNPPAAIWFLIWIMTLGPIQVPILAIAIIEGIIKLIKHLFAFGSAELDYARGENMYGDEKNDLEDKQNELVKQIAQLQAENPELMNDDVITKELSKTISDTSLKPTYDGYFAEVAKDLL
ncbi:hypothetical protein FJY90_04450 [Candidatus Gottesmanbacteria bacterium]|nr:hypothetical protein [Candidatus Gottesmanbacteria bacterium]